MSETNMNVFICICIVSLFFAFFYFITPRAAFGGLYIFYFAQRQKEFCMIYDVAIIGCGVVGAAVAYNLAKYNINAVIIEQENDVANKTTKANSAILHAGYDPEPNTQMARLNVNGVKLAQQICTALDVPYRQTGSLVLAFNDDDMEHINKLYKNGIANGVPDIKILNAQQVQKLEPNISVRVKGALHAPSAAIVSPWEYALAMAQTAVKNGVKLRLNTKVLSITSTCDNDKNTMYNIFTNNGEISAKFVVNAAGVNSDVINDMVCEHQFDIETSKGEYYLLDKIEGARVNSIVFQCPTKVGKGVLVAPTVHGNLIVGPNAVDTQKSDVSTSASGLLFVAQTAKKSVPNIDFSASIRNFAGLRAVAKGHSDFIISFAAKHFLNLAGMKSPGLSAAAAIGELAAEMLCEEGLNCSINPNFINERSRIKFKELSLEDKTALINAQPEFGRVICRCETVTEGEILQAINMEIPPCSIDGVKRRVGAGMGRCQGGFCGPRVAEILARELNLDMTDILQDANGTNILTSRTKNVQEIEKGGV